MRKATAFRGGANKTAPPCETLVVNNPLQLFRGNSCNEILLYRKFLLLGKTIFSVRQKGVPPLLLPASVLQLPRCLARIYNLDSYHSTLFEFDSFKICNCTGKPICKIQFASQMWATRPHLGSIFEKLLHRKTFYFACGSYLTTHLEKIFQEPFHKLQSLSTPQPNPTFHNSLFFSG